MPRKKPRSFLPFSSKGRNLDIIRKTDTVETSATLAAGADTVFSLTTKSKKSIALLTQEDISLFETSVAEANLIPNGSSIDASDYQIIGPWREQSDGDSKNIVSKIYVRNTTSSTDFSKRVAASADDGWRVVGSGSWDYTGISYIIGQDSGEVRDLTAAVRFLNVTIPQGVTINSATITVTAVVTDPDEVTTKIKGIDEDNTATFTSDPTGRAETTAGVDWDFGNVTQDEQYTSPDISTVIQEIVDRGGWSSGNALGLFIKNDGSSNGDNLNLTSFDDANGATDACLLDVNWGSGSSKTVLFRGRARYISPRSDVTIT